MGKAAHQLSPQAFLYVGCIQKALSTLEDDLPCSTNTSWKHFHRLPRGRSELMTCLTKLTSKFNCHKGLVACKRTCLGRMV